MTDEHPFTRVPVPPGHVAIHWFGQSSFALKTPAGTIVQLDPFFPRQRPAERFLHPSSPLDETSLPTQAVLLTHVHADHTCIESLARIDDAQPDVRFLGPVESARRLRAAGLDLRDEDILSAGDSRTIGDLRVHAVYAKPPEGDPPRGIAPPDVTHLGYVFAVGAIRIWFSGDPIASFAERDDLIGPVRRLAPTVGFLTTQPAEGEFPDFAASVRMATGAGLKTVVPQHYACFVERTFDPAVWARAFPRGGGPQPYVLRYDAHALFPLPAGSGT